MNDSEPEATASTTSPELPAEDGLSGGSSSPRSPTPARSHHARSLARDKQTVRHLIRFRRAYWTAQGQDLLQRSPSGTLSFWRTRTSRPTGDAPTAPALGAKRSQSIRRIMPAKWNETTPLLKAIAATMALQEEGMQLVWFKLKPHEDLAFKLKGRVENPGKQGPADYLRRRIVELCTMEANGADGDLVCVLITDVSSRGTFDTQGVLNRPATDTLHQALRKAGGEWNKSKGRENQVDLGQNPVTPGWAIDAFKEAGGIQHAQLSMALTVKTKATHFYSTFRDWVLIEKQRSHASGAKRRKNASKTKP